MLRLVFLGAVVVLSTPLELLVVHEMKVFCDGMAVEFYSLSPTLCFNQIYTKCDTRIKVILNRYICFF